MRRKSSAYDEVKGIVNVAREGSGANEVALADHKRPVCERAQRECSDEDWHRRRHQQTLTLGCEHSEEEIDEKLEEVTGSRV